MARPSDGTRWPSPDWPDADARRGWPAPVEVQPAHSRQPEGAARLASSFAHTRGECPHCREISPKQFEARIKDWRTGQGKGTAARPPDRGRGRQEQRKQAGNLARLYIWARDPIRWRVRDLGVAGSTSSSAVALVWPRAPIMCASVAACAASELHSDPAGVRPHSCPFLERVRQDNGTAFSTRRARSSRTAGT